MYGSCSSNALYPSSLLFMFIFLLTLFQVYDQAWFLLIKVFLTNKHVMLFCSLPNMKNNFPLWVDFCVYLMFHWGMILSKKCQKPAVHKKGGLAILGGCLEKRGSNLMQTMNVLATKTQSTYIYDRKLNKIKKTMEKTIQMYYLVL